MRKTINTEPISKNNLVHLYLPRFYTKSITAKHQNNLSKRLYAHDRSVYAVISMGKYPNRKI